MLVIVFISVSARGNADVFHNGGTGNCGGCHISGSSLINSDAASTCLSCHMAPASVSTPTGPYIATDARYSQVSVQMPQAGDFFWLTKTFKGCEVSPGERHGHNVVAVDYGYVPDSTLSYAPGGTYPSANLSCISCHDPHGDYRRNADGTISTSGQPIVASGSYSNSPDPTATSSVGTYRLLAGKSYQPKTIPGAIVFTYDPPATVAPPITNRSETSTDTRIAYGSGMSEWCQNCHPQISGTCQHRSGNQASITQEEANNYTMYVKSGDLSGHQSTAYTSMVPYEMGTNDYQVLKNTANTNGQSQMTNGGNVMCLTCHRAHSSGWDSIMRWDVKDTYLVFNGQYPGIDNNGAQYAGGRLSVEVQKTFYDRSASRYSIYQRSLCSKCHARD
jgi:hypothetical protein